MTILGHPTGDWSKTFFWLNFQIFQHFDQMYFLEFITWHVKNRPHNVLKRKESILCLVWSLSSSSTFSIACYNYTRPHHKQAHNVLKRNHQYLEYEWVLASIKFWRKKKILSLMLSMNEFWLEQRKLCGIPIIPASPPSFCMYC